MVHEDEHLLVVNKPSGLNTHSPSPYAGEGIYEWLRHREPRWAQLAIIHRLDKATSGLMVFAKTKVANKSLTEQFTRREVHKTYVLLTTRAPEEREFTVRSGLVRAGEKYRSAPEGEAAETRFRYVGLRQDFHLMVAEPLTGRTHQIRVHCEQSRTPILGDAVYGGEKFARVCLHAQQLRFRHPETGGRVEFVNEPDFFANPALELRRLLIEPDQTTAFRLLHGASDQVSFYLERWGDFQLAQAEQAVEEPLPPARGSYFKRLNRQVARASQEESAPRLVTGSAAPSAFEIRENGVRFEISFEQGYSVGLFLDQRDNRRRLLANYIAPDFPLFKEGLAGRQVLNAFAYTCGFSVCAGLAGATTTSLDLSKKYLEWGARNFRLNGVDPALHDFIYGDVFDWVRRLGKKGRRFDVVILDPPTFSRGRQGTFRAEKDFGSLISEVLPLLTTGGVLFASTNAQKLAPEEFLEQINSAVASAGRAVMRAHYVPQPVDFPISHEERAYLKTVWLRVS